MSGRLQGIGVVLTRPRGAAEPLRAELAREGARVYLLPALEIEDIALSDTAARLLDRLDRFSLAIFVSANSVEKGLAAVRRAAPWPQGLAVAAVGETTAQALRNSGFDAVISPHERHDSDALLALARLHSVEGEDIIVFRGEGGRERIKEVLEARGARVSYAEVYRRVRPRVDPAPVEEALARGDVQAVSALSAETLENFVDMIGAAAARLATVALVVPHAAIAATPAARRFARSVVAGHGAAGLVEALAALRVTT
jgi:uroporphyrinogen-III synthase